MTDAERAAPDPASAQRIADAAAHRAAIAARIEAAVSDGENWLTVSAATAVEAERVTEKAMTAGVDYIARATLPADAAFGRRGTIDLLVRTTTGYVPVLVVRHRITDRGSGARTSLLELPFPSAATLDTARKSRSHPRDTLRLAHSVRMLQEAGFAPDDARFGGVVGLDADVVVWHDLRAANWPDQRDTFAEYDARFCDRLAVARAAASGDQPLAFPSRVLQCRGCPWWPVCSAELTRTRDVSLVVRGDGANMLRAANIPTVDALAHADPAAAPEPMSAGRFSDAVVLARAWLADLTVVRRVRELTVPRADVELDVDMESFGDSGAYLWGCLLSGVDVGLPLGYRAFATWSALPSDDEARSFAEFWAFLCDVRERAKSEGASFAAYCYNELAENRWLLSSADRFSGMAGIPPRSGVEAFIDSREWVDLYRTVSDQFLCSHGKGLKVVAPAAGFHWRDPEAGGENSMRWYRDAVGMDGRPPDQDQRTRLLRYNEDDVRATRALRGWIDGPAGTEVPFAGDL